MYTQLDQEVLLGAEAGVSLDLDDTGADAHEWDIDRNDVLDVAEQEAWTRHAARAAGLATASADEDFASSALTDAVRRVMDMNWD